MADVKPEIEAFVAQSLRRILPDLPENVNVKVDFGDAQSPGDVGDALAVLNFELSGTLKIV